MINSVKSVCYTPCPSPFPQYLVHQQVLLVLLHIAGLFTSLHLYCYQLVQAAIIIGMVYHRSLLTGLPASILDPP